MTHSFPTRRSSDLGELIGRTHTTAPPEKLKKDRQNEDAAHAMDRPKTIWTSLRKPPDASPKASARPVAMMMMTPTIRATGPSMASRMACRGPSPGVLEPAACVRVLKWEGHGKSGSKSRGSRGYLKVKKK